MLRPSRRNPAFVAARPTIADIRDHGADPIYADNGAAFQRAIDAVGAGGTVYIPPGPRWNIATTLTAKSGVTLAGEGGLQDTSSGSILYWTNSGSAVPAIVSDPGAYLSSAGFKDFSIYTPEGPTPTYLAGADAFQLYGVTNNCRFENVYTARFRGNAFTCNRQTLDPSDPTGCGNVTFAQTFVSRCAGWGFDIEGYTIATWMLPDINTPGKGAFRFHGGIANQMAPVIMGGWFEGGCYAGTEEILVEDSNGRMPITLVGCSFQNIGNIGQDSVIRATGTGGVAASLTNCVGFGYDYWIADEVNGKNLGFISQVSYEGAGFIADSASVVSSTPTFDIQDNDGTADQRKFRLTLGGNELQIQGRTDASILASTPMKLRHNDSRVTFGGQVIFGTDNASDIGASGATRPRDLYLGRNAVVGGALDHDGSTAGFYGVTPVTRASVAAAATDAATTQTLANDLRAALIALGLVS